MAWYSAEIKPYPVQQRGRIPNESSPDQVVYVRTDRLEAAQLITQLVGSQYCDLCYVPSEKRLTLYVAAPPNYPLAELRDAIHCALRDHLLALMQTRRDR